MTERDLWREVHQDLYAVLGVSAEADQEQIHKSWRSAAKSTHPDSGGDGERFRAVNVAYLVLSDPAQRERYDRARRPAEHAVWVESAPQQRQPQWQASQRSPYESPALLWLFAAAAVVAVVGAYIWPGFAILTGLAVGVLVLSRYHQMGFGLTRRR